MYVLLSSSSWKTPNPKSDPSDPHPLWTPNLGPDMTQSRGGHHVQPLSETTGTRRIISGACPASDYRGLLFQKKPNFLRLISGRFSKSVPAEISLGWDFAQRIFAEVCLKAEVFLRHWPCSLRGETFFFRFVWNACLWEQTGPKAKLFLPCISLDGGGFGWGLMKTNCFCANWSVSRQIHSAEKFKWTKFASNAGVESFTPVYLTRPWFQPAPKFLLFCCKLLSTSRQEKSRCWKTWARVRHWAVTTSSCKKVFLR